MFATVCPSPITSIQLQECAALASPSSRSCQGQRLEISLKGPVAHAVASCTCQNPAPSTLNWKKRVYINCKVLEESHFLFETREMAQSHSSCKWLICDTHCVITSMVARAGIKSLPILLYHLYNTMVCFWIIG